jgi:hypothetical protein
MWPYMWTMVKQVRHPEELPRGFRVDYELLLFFAWTVNYYYCLLFSFFCFSFFFLRSFFLLILFLTWSQL